LAQVARIGVRYSYIPSYWRTLWERSREAHGQRVASEDLARELAAEWDWAEAERLAVNVESLYREHAGGLSVNANDIVTPAPESPIKLPRDTTVDDLANL